MFGTFLFKGILIKVILLLLLQEMNLAYKYPTMFWNCACLIADSGGAKSDEDEMT